MHRVEGEEEAIHIAGFIKTTGIRIWRSKDKFTQIQ